MPRPQIVDHNTGFAIFLHHCYGSTVCVFSSNVGSLKRGFHEPTNHAYERLNTVQTIDLVRLINWSAD